MIKVFYFGGQKSGKTNAGIKKALELSNDDKQKALVSNLTNDLKLN